MGNRLSNKPGLFLKNLSVEAKQRLEISRAEFSKVYGESVTMSDFIELASTMLENWDW